MIGRSFADLTDAFNWVGRFNEATETARASAALREALDLASQVSDPKLEARLLGARSIANFHYFRFV
jgi:hypothetical protein